MTDDYTVEGILVRGETDFISKSIGCGQTCDVSNECPTTGCRGEDVTKSTEFVDLIPPVASGFLPDTGIMQCYDHTQAMECPSLGEPFYGQDAQYTTNPMSYTDNGNGTVTDNVTVLMWQKCSAGLSGSECTVGTVETRTWADAITYCEGSTLAGYSDWRLPDEYELQSIVDYGRYGPAIDTTAFPGTVGSDVSSMYWSSSTCAHDANGACYVFSYNGLVNCYFKAYSTYVRCVRAETLSNAFTDNFDGTVTDNVTWLMWQQEDDNAARNWEDALGYCENLILPPGGHSDWRLPDVKELRSIVDNTRYNPAIDTAAFPGTNWDGYWSSSTYAQHPSTAWFVDFSLNNVHHITKYDTYYVRSLLSKISFTEINL